MDCENNNKKQVKCHDGNQEKAQRGACFRSGGGGGQGVNGRFLQSHVKPFLKKDYFISEAELEKEGERSPIYWLTP